MQEETRRALQLCNEEVATLKLTMKDYESRVFSLTVENDKLFKELE
jgi:hypothetical protein